MTVRCHVSTSIAGLLAASLAVLLGACAILPSSAPRPGQSEEPAVSREERFSRIASSDPRVAATLVASVHRSGFADVYAVEVAISGPDPVKSETIARVLTAALDNAPKKSVHQVLFRARSDEDPDVVLDITSAVEEIPSDVAARFSVDSTGELALDKPNLGSLRRASQ